MCQREVEGNLTEKEGKEFYKCVCGSVCMFSINVSDDKQCAMSQINAQPVCCEM